MRFDIITLFPELFAPFLTSGITRRAFEPGGSIAVKLWNLRDFAPGNYRRVDDRPFGGGPGMVMQAEPLALCLEAICADRQAQTAPAVVLFSPAGQTLNHARVAQWAEDTAGAVLVCGRYEGIDQRFIDTFVSAQISLGDFVLSGGEIAAIALLDSVARLQPGVLGDEASHQQDSFNPLVHGLLDCGHYTRPEVWRGQSVPPVLLSGNHREIERWRAAERYRLSAEHRPDLLPIQAAGIGEKTASSTAKKL